MGTSAEARPMPTPARALPARMVESPVALAASAAPSSSGSVMTRKARLQPACAKQRVFGSEAKLQCPE